MKSILKIAGDHIYYSRTTGECIEVFEYNSKVMVYSFVEFPNNLYFINKSKFELEYKKL